mgnify:CR=1 FL=1
MGSNQHFGGDWTIEKLERVKKYLQAYTTIMNKQVFKFAYIDAFAGTGYVEFSKEEDQGPGLIELAEEEPQCFIHGSARIALQVRPRFQKYVFIEKSNKRCHELYKLKDNFPELASDIKIINGEANSIIQKICKEVNWRTNRALLFLDPYGMQVKWETLVAIAETKAIDLWILFPLGVAVNRMLKKDGQINELWLSRLDEIFGTREWYDAFYKTKTSSTLFGNVEQTEKVAKIDDIGKYFVSRLKTIFTDVAENPLPLYNSRNNPLFLLCFAVGNPKGAPTAIKIAKHILKKR